jgi:hypothetical protein
MIAKCIVEKATDTNRAFGIFIEEDLLGTVGTPTETNDSRRFQAIISTRSAAEVLVHARADSISPAGNLAAQIRLRLWVCGTDVGAGLRTRRTNERAAVERE